jgi:hypothetical protein
MRDAMKSFSVLRTVPCDLGAPATMVERERQLADAQSGFFDAIPLSIAQMLEGSADDFPEVATAIGQGLLIELKFEELGKLVDLWQRYEPKAPMPLVFRPWSINTNSNGAQRVRSWSRRWNWTQIIYQPNLRWPNLSCSSISLCQLQICIASFCLG